MLFRQLMKLRLQTGLFLRVVRLKILLSDLLGLFFQLGVLLEGVARLLKNFTLPNLMHTQAPIFFDGNGAGTAGVAEMLTADGWLQTSRGAPIPCPL